ncbi:hypothetical protein Fmac_027657 [Flemingia macrophylla]|uniref:Uncharacterized protein n=1 Tax=Flemingia macrophylla TaxID=520843 RepID=A0ABD1LIC2_9FABA
MLLQCGVSPLEQELEKGNMKKGICSPGRTEKFPPPLMRFLVNSAGSGSRSRSRSRSRGRSSWRSTTTMFLRKKNTATEPSSPKVTCMGQVRVSDAAAPPECRYCCRWVPHRLVSCFPFTTTEKIDSSQESNSRRSGSGSVSVSVRVRVRPSAVVSAGNASLLTRCRSAPGRRLWKEEYTEREGKEYPVVLTRCKSQPPHKNLGL